MISIVSSTIKAVGYEDSTLTVEFNTGAMYKYYSVPAKVYKELLESPSPGSYLASKIKPVYDYGRV